LAEASSSKTGQVAATSGTIAQCLNLEHEIHQTASRLCILGFEPLEQSLIAGTLPIKPRGFRIPH
jgi:hypothetical protein